MSMIYCPTCQMNYTGIQLEPNSICPTCQTEIREIKSQRLIDLLHELNAAVIQMQSKDMQSSPRKILEVAKTIGKGEKSLSREYAKRIEQIRDLDYELHVITKYADFMGYTLEVKTDDK